MSKIIGIVGSRKRDCKDDFNVVMSQFRKYYEPGDRICSGGCPRGGDRFAEKIASWTGMTEDNRQLILHRPKPVPKDSPKYIYAKAFYERNTLVARDSDILIAVVDPSRKGGTEDTIKKWKKFHPDNICNLVIV